MIITITLFRERGVTILFNFLS